ncbi:MAG: YbjN domain-containing protein [Armatimonadetes bacterium]|nr:YbjN domain-containing protein [Anaerolineae bacterium]
MVFRLRQDKNSPVLQNHIATIENILSMLDVNPSEARAHTMESYRWAFRWGSVEVDVNIMERGSRAFFQVTAPIIYLPDSQRENLLYGILELNLEMTSAAMGVYRDVIYVFSERPIEGMDAEEARFIITQVAHYADELDHRLVQDFGGRLYHPQP